MSSPCERCGHQNADEARFCLKCGAMVEQEVVDAADPLIGKILLGRFRILRVLGEGGMGTVYLGNQKMGNATREVAIKTLHPEMSSDPQLVARFHRECETVIELHHPNTVQFFDFGEMEDHTLFIVMEYIEGADLAHVLQEQGVIAPTRADRLIIQICGSLHEAHEHGIVHRDLKPENVLLTERGGQTDFVKVLDFGIAKRNEAEDDSQAKLTKQGMVLGTPPYMSPEQFSGQELDRRSDIYSLGAMTYEMVTGSLPFTAKTPWEWATKHLTCEPTPIGQYPAGATLPINKQNAIMRALSKSPDHRQPTAQAFMQEFTGIGDAQSAWTMATSGGISGGATPPPTNYSQAPITPPPTGPAPFTGANPTPAPGVYGSGPGSYASGPSGYGSGPTPMASMDYATGSAPSSGGSAGKILIGLVLVLFVLGGAGGAGIWWYMNRTPSVAGATPNLPPTNLGAGTPVAPMVPSTPMQPTIPTPPPMQPTTPTVVDAGVRAVPTPPETPPETPPTMDDSPSSNGPSAAALARARDLVQQGQSAISQNDIDGAVRALNEAQRAVGRSNSVLRPLRTQLGQRASFKVGVLLQQGNCPGAQALYRSLRGVGADRPSRSQFAGDWCRAP